MRTGARTPLVFFLTGTLCCGCVPLANGGEDRDTNDPIRLRLLGALEHTRVDVRLAESSAREALAMLEAALGVRIMTRWDVIIMVTGSTRRSRLHSRSKTQPAETRWS